MRKILFRILIAVSAFVAVAGVILVLGYVWLATFDPFPGFSESKPAASFTPVTDLFSALDPQGPASGNFVFARSNPTGTKLRSPATVYALDAETGAEQWRVRTSGPVRGTPAVSGSALYFADDAGTLYGVELDTGRVGWRFNAGAGKRVQSPVVASGLVIFGVEQTSGSLLTIFDAAGIVYALDAATGVERWQTTTEQSISDSLAVANGLVYVPAGEDGLHALDAQTGKEKWAYPSGWSISAPIVLDDTVFVVVVNSPASERGTLVALDAATGSQRWSVFTGYSSAVEPAAAQGTVFVATGRTSEYAYAGVLALDAATGQERWHFVTDGNVRAPVAVGGDTVAVSSAICREPVYDWFLICMQGWVASVYGVDAATGGYQWRFGLEEPVYAPMQIIGDLVYVTDGGGTLWALDRKTGDEAWRFST